MILLLSIFLFLSAGVFAIMALVVIKTSKDFPETPAAIETKNEATIKRLQSNLDSALNERFKE